MNHWPMVPLGELLDHRKQFIEINDLERYKRCRVQLHAQGIVLRDNVPGAEIKTKKQQVCKAGEFLVAEIDAKLGGYGIVPAELDGAIVSSHYFLFGIREERIDHSFLGYFIRTPGFFEQVAAQGSTNYAAIRPGHVLEYKIPLPPLPEQRRLVERIDALAAKIGEAKGLRRESDARCSDFVGSMHTFLARGRNVKLRDVISLHEDRVPIVAGHEYPQVGVRGFGGGLFARETLTSKQTTYKSFNRLYPGMLVLSQVKGWEGAVAMCPQSLSGRYVSPEYRTFRCNNDELHTDYFKTIVPTEWFWGRLSTMTRGVGARRERIRPELFLDMELPMPTLADQQRGIKAFHQLQGTYSDRRLIPSVLEAMLPAILDRAFRGEL